MSQNIDAHNTLAIFVYGTLKRGFENHERFCEGALQIEEAAVNGHLYDLPFGFPALVVSDEDIHAIGTPDATMDTAVQHKPNQPATAPLRENPRVFGELLVFDDPEDRLPKLDRLEGFEPNGRSLYRRVLVGAETPTRTLLAWAYAIEEPAGTHLPGGFWSA